MTLVLAVIVIALAIVAVARGDDVRLSLMIAALALGTIAGNPLPIIQKFLETFSRETFVVPICTAMGFAHVLRLTGCDRHMVRLLVEPLRHGRALMVPGVIAVGFLVNIPVISQTSTAACLGAVVVPLMRAGGFSPVIVGATLLLGASVGGELLNPGAPELNTVCNVLNARPGQEPIDARGMVRTMLPLALVQLLVAGALFWLLSGGMPTEADHEPPPDLGERLNLLKALVPLVPLVLLFLAGPPVNAITIPRDWLAPSPSGVTLTVAQEQALEASANVRQVGLAMLIGVAVAALASPGTFARTGIAFFEGAGYGFTHIISLIVTATCFSKGVEMTGLANFIGVAVNHAPALLYPLATGLSLMFAALTGSGMATTQGLFGFFVPPSEATGADPARVGAVVSLAAAAGRTMSPVAAVTLMCASLTGTSPLALARLVALPLIIGAACAAAAAWAGW